MIDTSNRESSAAKSARTAVGPDGVPPTHDHSAKRRKVRKGTRSCWECKRRKIRCIFQSQHDVTCLGCQRRRAICISQELPEELSPARTGNRHLGDRISKVEDFMKEVLASKHVNATNHREGRSKSGTQATGSEDSGVSPAQIPLILQESCIPRSPLLAPNLEDGSSQDDANTILHRLLTAFPAEEDARIILKECPRTSLYTCIVSAQPYSKLTLEFLAAPCPAAELPRLNTHPVILAKNMLTLAITLQIPGKGKFLGLSEPQDTIMRRLVTAARTWVIRNEEMQGTVEGLVCILLEGIFETNSGNLRRAWGVYRRAMTTAQLIGLHRSPTPPLKRIDPETDVEPEIIWCRIVHMDRYLSLLLGLPQGTSDKSMGAPSAVQNEPPLGRFERLLTVIASRVLERNERAFSPSEIDETRNIDAALLRISTSMPAYFWRPATFHGLTVGEPDTFLETLRLGAHVYYYGLLIQLHLPYMMQVGAKIVQEYSKITCVNASREILTRFISHRSFNPVSTCSRPVDFFALLAATTLLLAHLDAHHRDEINFLAHQRLSDRAMLEQVIESMTVISNVSADVVSEESAKLIRRLLDIEADAAGGKKYTTKSMTENNSTARGDELRLQIPYLGVINIARKEPVSGAPPREHHDGCSHQEAPAGADDGFISFPGADTIGEQRLSRWGDTPLEPTFASSLSESERLGAQQQASGHEEPMLQYPTPGHENVSLQHTSGIPYIAASGEEWPFQGVDMAFFDSVMRGSSGVDVDGCERQWTGDAPGIDCDQLG